LFSVAANNHRLHSLGQKRTIWHLQSPLKHCDELLSACDYSTGSGGSSLVYSAIGTELTSPIGQSFAGYAASSTSTNDPGLSKLDRASRAASIEHSGSTASLQQYVYGIAATLCGWSGPRAPDPFPNPFGAPAVFVSESRLQRCSFAFAC